MESDATSQLHQTEIPAPITLYPHTCPEMVQQIGHGGIAVTVLISVIVLIRSVTDLVKAKA